MTTSLPAGAYRLVREPVAPAVPPALDSHQQAVVDHRGGPLLVLAGPGTGKTTTLVEAVAARIAEGVPPEEILVLTFSRKAAVELRDRITARVGAFGGLGGPGAGTAAAPQATTFHSFCYALLRAHQEPDLYAEPLRLLSGPEQDVLVRELLTGGAEDARAGLAAGPGWPAELRAALTTRGFADEVRAVLARARELGLGEMQLARFAERVGRPDWAAAAHFLAEYLDVLDGQDLLDYAELVHRAVLLAERPEVGEQLRRTFTVVFVDEYQDTDPSQTRLLRALAGSGRELVAVGDPDQSIYAFRGADVNGILDFPHDFPQADGRPAPIRVLRVSRRAGRRLLASSRVLAGRLPAGRLPAAALAAHRDLVPAREGGSVEVLTFPTPGAELDNIADLLRRAHLEQQVPWSEMAVLVRAGARSLPGLRRVLTSAGVPVEIDGDDLPLHAEPAVAPLLVALRLCALSATRARRLSAGAADAIPSQPGPGDDAAAVSGAETDTAPAVSWGDQVDDVEAPAAGAPGTVEGPDDAARPVSAVASGAVGDIVGDVASAEHVGDLRFRSAVLDPEDPLTVEVAEQLLTGPLAALDGADLRQLGRALREGERSALREVPAEERRAVRPAGELIREALAEPERLVLLAGPAARRARELGLLLRKVRDLLLGGATAEDALWALWESSSPWRERLERAALRGGAAGRNADRDLDALCALFEAAARAELRAGGPRGALNFLAELEQQDIAADTLSGRAVRTDAVRLMTAHRSKGLEWRLVVVAGVQEGLWPDLRRRGSLLEADRIGREGLAEPMPQSALLAEERRLFYVACTRAKERLVVTAVQAAAEDGDEPSRFLRELYRERPDGTREPEVRVEDVTHRPRRALSVAALVAELRATSVDPAASPQLREAAAERLARLAELTDEDGLPLVPAADPHRWWGMADLTENEVPVRDPAGPVELSGSALESVNACSLQWFLGREVRAQEVSSGAQGFGNVVHVLAEEVGSGRTPADLDVLMARLDRVWDAVAFDAPWKSEQEKGEARAALERFLTWHSAERGRVPVAVEQPFDVELKAGPYAVRIRGTMDRVERENATGAAYVVDFKTGRNTPTRAQVEEHPQLGVYQLAVREGAVDEAFDGVHPEPGGAELVQLRQPASRTADEVPKVQHQAGLEEHPSGGEWIEGLLAEAADRVLRERFLPTTGDQCGHCSFHGSCSARPEGRQVVE
ncbi:ATP-dependent helicase [Streptacidiphilus jiangxiensis]|uniref:DNA 3'-5' helicase n=1 Tax=Streptacidiphilus jiangxiensis TaxID=235985 RepID=A0A1H7G2F8_STRJI|nr:ATP-dependent DNA helicase [Streptacidiphilus jiangxiensis]SEK29865.1 UvrD-like helicase C-terminal domain-containing protein [Streptacidiphilus jiangxiensis]